MVYSTQINKLTMKIPGAYYKVKKMINTKRWREGKGSKRGQEEENKMTTNGKELGLFYDTL